MGSLLLPLLLVTIVQAGSATPGSVDTLELPVAPALSGRSVFIGQIGVGNDATIQQSAPRAHAELIQRGDGNVADATQRDTGTSYLRAAQTGDANRFLTVQTGTDASSLWIDQTGNANRIAASQSTYGTVYNGAVLAQNGVGNDMSLVQSGSDNRAALVQTGDENSMTAVQNGTGNQLAWVQEGSGLSDLGIVQNGGQTLMVTQSGGR